MRNDVEAWREFGRLPDNLSKPFVEALKRGERSRLASELRAALLAEVDRGATDEPALLTCAYRLARCQTIRKEKGEIKSTTA